MYRLRPAGAVVPLLLSGEDLWLLLLSANALDHFTFYVPVADRGDEESDSINAPLFWTLIIHCETPYLRYRFGLSSALHAPTSRTSRDSMEDEIGVSRGSNTIFASSGVKPKFPIVTRLRLHDSTAEG